MSAAYNFVCFISKNSGPIIINISLTFHFLWTLVSVVNWMNLCFADNDNDLSRSDVNVV